MDQNRAFKRITFPHQTKSEQELYTKSKNKPDGVHGMEIDSKKSRVDLVESNFDELHHSPNPMMVQPQKAAFEEETFALEQKQSHQPKHAIFNLPEGTTPHTNTDEVVDHFDDSREEKRNDELGKTAHGEEEYVLQKIREIFSNHHIHDDALGMQSDEIFEQIEVLCCNYTDNNHKYRSSTNLYNDLEDDHEHKNNYITPTSGGSNDIEFDDTFPVVIKMEICGN
eukprot:74865_1